MESKAPSRNLFSKTTLKRGTPRDSDYPSLSSLEIRNHENSSFCLFRK